MHAGRQTAQWHEINGYLYDHPVGLRDHSYLDCRPESTRSRRGLRPESTQRRRQSRGDSRRMTALRRVEAVESLKPMKASDLWDLLATEDALMTCLIKTWAVPQRVHHGSRRGQSRTGVTGAAHSHRSGPRIESESEGPGSVSVDVAYASCSKWKSLIGRPWHRVVAGMPNALREHMVATGATSCHLEINEKILEHISALARENQPAIS